MDLGLIYPEAEAPGESYGGVHPTLGLDGYPAVDFFAPAGTIVVAPEPGKIVKLSGHPTTQPPTGAGGAYGLSEYLLGQSGAEYFVTHLDTEAVSLGQKVGAGQPLGTVADWQKFGYSTPNHVHIGVHDTAPGQPTAVTLETGTKLRSSDVAERGSGTATFNPLDPSHSGAPGAISKSAPIKQIVAGTNAALAAPAKIVKPITSVIDALTRAVKWLSNPENWKRIGLGVGGFVLIIGGLFIVVRG